MAQQATNPKIEELRFKLKSDPKSRLFYQLAEELRKVKAYAESEEVLRGGLTHNPTYLAAWVSLGRTLREEDKHREAVDAFSRAMQLDPGNMVAARLLGDSYLDLGDKVEAIKKYKLVRALLPVDEELDAIIETLDRELHPQALSAPPAPPAEESPFATDESRVAETAAATARQEQDTAAATGDAEPMRSAHEESPFEEPAPAATAAAVEVEQPLGVHVEPAPLAAEIGAPWPEEEAAGDVFAATEPSPPPPADDATNTVTMADLYVQQGFTDRAREIYSNILERQPDNDDVRRKLAVLQPPPQPAPQSEEGNVKVKKLESWLAKVKGGEEGRD